MIAWMSLLAVMCGVYIDNFDTFLRKTQVMV